MLFFLDIPTSIDFLNHPLSLPPFLAEATWHDSSMARHISNSWAVTWEMALGGSLFQALLDLGRTIAVGCLLFLLVTMGKNLLFEMNLAIFVEHLLWPIIVIVLFSNNGVVLANTCIAMKDAINNVNNSVIEGMITPDDLTAASALSQISDYNSAVAEIEGYRSQCDEFIDKEKMESCLEEVASLSYEVRDEFLKRHPNQEEWISAIEDLIEFNKINPFSYSAKVVKANKGIQRAVSNAFESAIINFLYSIQIGIQHLSELAMLLTALMSPIAVAASLFPSQNKAILTWAVGFWSIGLFKISYNLIVGLISVSFVEGFQGAGGSNLPFTVTLTILSPLLAFTLASGGGLGIFNGVTQAAGAVASTGIRTASRVSSVSGGSINRAMGSFVKAHEK